MPLQGLRLHCPSVCGHDLEAEHAIGSPFCPVGMAVLLTHAHSDRDLVFKWHSHISRLKVVVADYDARCSPGVEAKRYGISLHYFQNRMRL